MNKQQNNTFPKPTHKLRQDYNDAFPLGSKGSKSAMKPETTNRAPAIKIGTLVVRFAYRAMIGACTPKT